MQVIVISAGRSGTNLLLECMTGHPYLIPTSILEDKYLFMRDDFQLIGHGGLEYPNRFLTKCDTVYIISEQHFHNFMRSNKNANLLWSTRHPYDWVLAKMYSGRAENNPNGVPADDATLEGCKFDMFDMYKYLKLAEADYPLRILRVKLEDILTDIVQECRKICRFLCIPYEEDMTTPYLRMRDKGYKKKYGNKLDASRINLYKNIETAYDGYFIDKRKMVEELFEYVKPLVKGLGYEE